MRSNPLEVVFVQHSGGGHYHVLFFRPGTWERKRSRQDDRNGTRLCELESFSRRFAAGNRKGQRARGPNTIYVTARWSGARGCLEGLAPTLDCGLVGRWKGAAYVKHNVKLNSSASLRGP